MDYSATSSDLTLSESYVTADENETQYLSVLDTTQEVSIDEMNLTLSNSKLQIIDPEEGDNTLEGVAEQVNEPFVFSIEGHDEVFGIQEAQDEQGNLQRYQFQYQKNESGDLVPMLDSIQLLPNEDAVENEVQFEEETDAIDNTEENSNFNENNDAEQPETKVFVNETAGIANENKIHENVHAKFAAVNIKTENFLEEQTNQAEENEQIPQIPVEPNEGSFQVIGELIDHEALRNQEMDQEIDQEIDQAPHEIEYEEVDHTEMDEPEVEYAENAQQHITDQEKHYEELFIEERCPSASEDSNGVQYQSHSVGHEHITGEDDNVFDVENVENVLRESLEHRVEHPKRNILRKYPPSPKKQLLLPKVELKTTEKENMEENLLVESNSSAEYVTGTLRTSERSLLKTQFTISKIDAPVPEDPLKSSPRRAPSKEQLQHQHFMNFLNSTTIPLVPERKERLPRKQQIVTMTRPNEEIILEEMMMSNDGFIGPVVSNRNSKTLPILDYVELSDSNDEGKGGGKVKRKKKLRRVKTVDLTLSDSELDNFDGASNEKTSPTTASQAVKRRRGRPPKNPPKTPDSENPSQQDLENSTTDSESPSKKSRTETESDTGKVDIACPKCDKTFASQNSLKTHLQHHRIEDNMRKSKLAQPSTSTSSISTKIEFNHKCEKCNQNFKNNALLTRHKCSLLSCTICKKTFPDQIKLNIHKKIHVKEQLVKKTITVAVSPKKFSLRQSTLQAKPFIKPKMSLKKEPLKCPTCSKVCSSQLILNTHVKTHKTFACQTCGSSFPSKLLLDQHVRENCVKMKSPKKRLSFKIRKSYAPSPKNRRMSLRKSNLPMLRPKITLDRPRRTTTVNKIPESPDLSSSSSSSARKMAALKIPCDQCDAVFPTYTKLFNHKVLVHKLETPDKRIAEGRGNQTKSLAKTLRSHSGIPANKKLKQTYAALRSKIENQDSQ